MNSKAMRTISLVVLACAVILGLWFWRRARHSEQFGPSGQLPLETITFNKHIAPIVFSNCSGCHRPGESAPFPLLRYSDVKQRAEQILDVTESRFMPPWLPSRGLLKFTDERILEDGEISLIRHWVEQGTVEGNPSDLPATPTWAEGWQLGEPDLVVSMPEPFVLPPDGKDVFRNFVIPVPIPSTRFVKAVEMRPGNRQVVHHAELLIDPTRASRYFDEQDPRPGYEGMEQGLSAVKPSGHFVA
jgi:hypothetical protein